MGGLCSKSELQGGHQVLASGSPGGNGVSGPANLERRREAAAAAAESRVQKQHQRGTQASNPNRGKLSQKLVASSSAASTKLAGQDREEEPLRWD